MTTLEILRRAREKISSPERWTKGDFAKKADGTPVQWYAEDAVCWCALGAVRSSSPNVLSAFDAEDLLDLAARELAPEVDSVASLNDSWGHEAVLKMFDDAIAKAEAQQ